jgi:uncharacterized protein with HEPN domain
MRDDRERLLDMLEAIQKIEQYAHKELVWRVVKHDIPNLKTQVEKF